MFSTVESRWFGYGLAPDDLKNWFNSLSGTPDRQPIRRDYYLRGIRDGSMSIKLREGGLEIKQRRESHGLVQFGPSREGLVEQWVKWRFLLDDSLDPFQSTITKTQPWLAIDKERRLRYYKVDEGDNVQSDSLPVDIPTAIHIELAAVWVGDSRWWSLAFEAGGEGSSAVDRLLAVARLQFHESKPPRLAGASSFGYPMWLASHVEAH